MVAAHPDDEVLGCGGTIAYHRAKADYVRVVFLAEGITARYSRDEFQTSRVVEESERRNENAIRALEILGVANEEVFTSERFCCRLDEVPQIELVKEVEHHVREWQPTRLFTHAADDPNVDHGLAHRAVIAAARPVVSPPLRSILTFEVLSSTEWNPTRPFPASIFTDITDQIELKVQALAAYEDEMRASPHPRSEEVVRALAKYRGAQIGVSFAEAFSVIRALYP